MIRTSFVIALLITVTATDVRAEYFFDAGVATHQVKTRNNTAPGSETVTDTGIHVGIGGRRPINERSDIGVRLELDSIDSSLLLAIRALDYRRHRSDRLAYGFFAGAARLDLATPAYGWYLGAGVELKQITENWNLNIDVRFADKVARDNLLPGESNERSPDNFRDVTGVSIYLSRRF